jgi:AbrB family looped-hinge helix DNA binding protein
MEAYVSSKGQIVIPAELRRKFRIETGTRLEITDDGERIILKPISPEYVRLLKGSLKGGGALESLKQDRLNEKDL